MIVMINVIIIKKLQCWQTAAPSKDIPPAPTPIVITTQVVRPGPS